MSQLPERQLSAVMFTDIVGYTALMQSDEKQAIAQRTRHREVFKQEHERHGGEIVQYYGDGTLSVFKSAVEACNCAMAIQHELGQGDPVPLRIGLHLGDIVFDKTEVYGDGVNLASRVESMAIAGSVLLSDKINDELKNQQQINTRSLGKFNLKNVERPVEVFAISNPGLAIPEIGELQRESKPSQKTIAVLPFVNMSADPNNEYFSDGITEEIINALSRIEQLKVTSRTSSFFFKGKHVPIKQIAEELNVSTILEGSVRLAGNMVRVNAQLIQAEEDSHFWSDSWDRSLDNIFEVQDEISLAIADKLREQFGHLDIQEHLVSKQTDSVLAYEFYLKGKHHFRQWNPENMKEAIQFYERALEADPEHVETLLGLGDAYSFLATTRTISQEEGWQKSMSLTQRAKEINDKHSGVHYNLANEAFFVLADFAGALDHALKAVEFNPNHAEAHQLLVFLYMSASRKDEAREHLDIALRINPLAQETRFYQAYFKYMTGSLEESLSELTGILEENPENVPALVVCNYVRLKLGQSEQVLDELESNRAEVIPAHDRLGLISLAHAFAGHQEQAANHLQKLQEEAIGPEGFRADSFLYMMYVAMGEFDKAFDWVERAMERKFAFLLFHYVDPLVEPLRDDPRYDAFLHQIYPSNLFAEHKPAKKAPMGKEEGMEHAGRILEYVREHKPHLNPDLSLRSLAEQLEIHPNQLSWVLNECLNKNFNQFINHYRVETFKKLALDPANANVTLLGLAYDSGFNSKTVFNTYFKKETGLTPKQFLTEQQS